MMTTFHIGLTMAGAISAGAYSAGVFDFLTEALDEWEKAKARQKDDEPGAVPTHAVVIPVISGASAGAVTGAVGLIAVAERPVDTPAAPTAYPQVGTVDVRLPRLFDAWVRKPCFVGATPDASCLLGMKDLNVHGRPVASLLDATILDEIAAQSVSGVQAVYPRPYFAKVMHLYFTHANLRGVPYDIAFTAGMPGQSGYPMTVHADRRRFEVAEAGTAAFDSPWVNNFGLPTADPGEALDITDLIGVTDVSKTAAAPAWKRYTEAALGSGAFPVGLPARLIGGVTQNDYHDRQWTIDVTGAPGPDRFKLRPAFPPNVDSAADYYTVDGGMINNEPFELARWNLMTSPPDPNGRSAAPPPPPVAGGEPPDPKSAASDRAVVMIDPFPEADGYPVRYDFDGSLLAIIKRLMPILKNQARFKPEELAAALRTDVKSRFLISPRRKSGPGPDVPLEPYAIACGLLGGFGGFLSEEFRAHDYQLGRLNCHLFLKHHFTLPLANPVVGAGYAGLAPAALAGFQQNNQPGAPEYQIIPLCGTAVATPNPPKWPRVASSEVDQMVAYAEKRTEKLFEKLKGEMSSPIGGAVTWLIWRAWGKDKVVDFVRWSVMRDLILRDQLSNYPTTGLSRDLRRVAAGLAHPDYDARTAAGVAREYDLDTAFVRNTLDGPTFSQIATKGRAGNGAEIWMLKERQRSLVRRLPIIRQIDEALVSGEPSFD